MAKLPCVPQSRIFTFKATGETMSYDQVRQYLMENPDIWQGAKEGKEVAMPTSNALKDVESTANALEGVNQNDLPLLRDSASNIVKEYEQAQKEVKRLNEEKSSLTDAEKDAIVKKSGYVKSSKYPDYYEFSTGASVKRKTKQEIVDGYYDKKIKAAKKDAPNDKVLELYKNQDRAYSTPQKISEAYHADKKAGKETELTKAVEDLLGAKEGRKVKKGDLVLKNGEAVTPTSINGKTVFYHGSTKTRKGRLRANWAEGFGEAVYFGTDKKAIEGDYEEEFTTEAYLNLKKPLYWNNKKDWDAVVEKAVELYSRKETPKLLDDYSQVVNGKREWYDEDAKAEYEAKGYIEPKSAENWVKEEDASWINKAAQELGYDAIIAPHHSFGEEIAVLDEKAIIYPEEVETEGGKEAEKQDPVVTFLRSLRSDPNVIGLNAGLWNAFLMTVEKAWIASKSAAKALQAGIDYLKSQKEDLKEWEKYIAPVRERLQQKEAAEKPPVTPPPTEKKQEMPEGEEEQVPKKVVERRYKADSPEMQKALEDIGLFRTPGNIEEAQKRASQLVAQVGVDAALEVAKNESIDGLYKIGIMGAVLQDIEDRRANTNDPEEFIRLTNEAARVTNEASNYLTTAGQELRMWQEILQSKDLPFEYEARKKAFVEQFGQEAFTKEVEERFESLNKQYQEALTKVNELEQQKANWERQSVIDDIANEKKEEPAKRKSFFKEAAERVRKLAFSKPGIFSSATPASLAWDASVEAVALALDGLGTLEIAIGKGLDKLRSTDWYRGLSNSKKAEAEKSFKEEVEKAYIPTVSVDDAGKVVIPEGTLKAYVEAGFRDAEEIVDHIYNQLINDNPNLTKRDVRDAISGYGRRYNPTPNQIRDQINEIKAIGKLISAIEDAQNGIEKTTNPQRKKDLSDRLKSLQQQYEAAYQNSFGRKPSQPSEATRYATVKRNMEKEIERLRAMKPRPERRPPVDYDTQLEALATEKFRLQEEWDAEFSKEEQRQKGIGTIIGDVAYGLTQLPKSVMAGGFDLGMLLIQGSMLSVSDLPTTKEASKNLVKALFSEKEYQKHIGQIRNSELYRIIRKSGLDLTIPFGKTLLVEETGIDTLAESLFNLLITPLKYIPEYGPKAYDFAKRFNFIRALNRAQTAYMNTLRVGVFLVDVQNMQLKGLTFYNNPNAYKEAAQGINTLSGRGGLYGAENSKIVMRALNITFFSPKNWSSILRLFTPVGLAIELGTKRSGADPYKMSFAQARIIRTFARFVAGTSLGILGVAALSNDEGDEDEEKKKETGNVSVDLKNPQSSAFAKIRVGNQIFDPWGGKMQIITLQARLLLHWMGKYPYKDPFTGIEKKLEDSYFKTQGGLVGEYVKGKFAPSLRAPWQLANSIAVPGRPGYYRPAEGGKEFYIFEPFQESYENLTIKALQETYGQQPLGISEIAALMIIAGGGVTTLNDPEDITTVGQIQNLLSPGEGEVKKFSKAFSNYLKAGDYDMAEKVFDKATGSYQLQQTIQQQQEAGKAVGDVERKLARKRKQSVKDLFENIREDNLVQKYSFEKRYRDEIIEAVYKDEVLPTSGVSEKKQQMFERINALTPEMKEDIKRNYDLQYEELMTVTKGLDKVAERADNYYEKKAKRTPWVKQYLRLTGKEEKK